MINTINLPDNKSFKRIIILSLILFLILTLLGNTILACNNVDTYQSDYSTSKDTYILGETVYGKETYGTKQTLKLRIKDPDDNVVLETEPVYSKIITCSYPLNLDEPLGQWLIQVGRFDDGSWHWLNGQGDIAYFTVITERPYTLTRNTTGNGTININPDETAYHDKTPVEITAQPDEGWSFDHWSEDLSGNKNPTTLIIDENKTVTAHFAKKIFTLSFEMEGQGTIAKDLDQEKFANGTIVTLTAAPSSGWKFTKWTGDIQASTSITTITMTKNATVKAHFTKENTPQYNHNPSTNNNQITTSSSTSSSTDSTNKDESTNIPPVAKITLSDSNSYTTDSAVKFLGILSYDPDGTITNWIWNFGQGHNLTGSTITRSYSTPGIYTIKLTVMDDNDTTNYTEKTIKITTPNNPPNTPIIQGPNNGTVNQPYLFTINSSDSDQDNLKYVIGWDDNTNNKSEWLTADQVYTVSHQWTNPGIYEIEARVTDGQDTSIETISFEIQDQKTTVSAIHVFIIIFISFLTGIFIIYFNKDKVKKMIGLHR